MSDTTGDEELAQLARLERAAQSLDSAKRLLWEAGEPMMATRISALHDRAVTEVARARERLGLNGYLEVPERSNEG